MKMPKDFVFPFTFLSQTVKSATELIDVIEDDIKLCKDIVIQKQFQIFHYQELLEVTSKDNQVLQDHNQNLLKTLESLTKQQKHELQEFNNYKQQFDERNQNELFQIRKELQNEQNKNISLINEFQQIRHLYNELQKKISNAVNNEQSLLIKNQELLHQIETLQLEQQELKSYSSMLESTHNEIVSYQVDKHNHYHNNRFGTVISNTVTNEMEQLHKTHVADMTKLHERIGSLEFDNAELKTEIIKLRYELKQKKKLEVTEFDEDVHMNGDQIANSSSISFSRTALPSSHRIPTPINKSLQPLSTLYNHPLLTESSHPTFSIASSNALVNPPITSISTSKPLSMPSFPVTTTSSIPLSSEFLTGSQPMVDVTHHDRPENLSIALSSTIPYNHRLQREPQNINLQQLDDDVYQDDDTITTITGVGIRRSTLNPVHSVEVVDDTTTTGQPKLFNPSNPRVGSFVKHATAIEFDSNEVLDWSTLLSSDRYASSLQPSNNPPNATTTTAVTISQGSSQKWIEIDNIMFPDDQGEDNPSQSNDQATGEFTKHQEFGVGGSSGHGYHHTPKKINKAKAKDRSNKSVRSSFSLEKIRQDIEKMKQVRNMTTTSTSKEHDEMQNLHHLQEISWIFPGGDVNSSSSHARDEDRFNVDENGDDEDGNLHLSTFQMTQNFANPSRPLHQGHSQTHRTYHIDDTIDNDMSNQFELPFDSDPEFST